MLSNKLLVNVSANIQGIVMMAITKKKQLLNELRYLVMANTANAFISPCLVMCVVRFVSVHSQSKSAFLINSTFNYCIPFFCFSFSTSKMSFSIASVIDFI